VQQRTPDENDWTQANLNYPVASGFAIAPQDGGRAEIQVGSMALRIGPASELDVTNLGDHDASFTLAQGELSVRLGRLANGDRIEIVTPRGVMQILAAGQYHIDAGTTESPTRFEVFNGRAELQRDGGNTALASGQAALINADADQSLTMASAAPDELDQWAFGRDRGPARAPTRTARAAPAAPYAAPAAPYASPDSPYTAPAAPYVSSDSPYVSPEMTGGADLSDYGNWNTDPQYGAIWYPRGVPSDWAPYTYGHWSWVSPWGWTWIDDEPWGFAPFHYGRWAYTGIGWGWIPGAYVETPPVYAPALVVFFGGGGGPFYYEGYRPGIGWCALGPRELFVPAYNVNVSVTYVRNVNITNVNINQFNITNVNNTIVVNNDPHWGGQVGNFANHRFATVVPAAQFGRSTQPVRDIAVHSAAATTTVAGLPISRAPAVAPPRTAAGTNAALNRSAQFNRPGQPPIPQAHTAAGAQPHQPVGGVSGANGSNTPTRSIAGHTLPTLPPAHGAANAGSGAPTRFGAGAETAIANTAHGRQPVPPPSGGAAAGSSASGRFGATTGMATNAGRGLPPVPSPHAAAPTAGSSAPNRFGTGAGTATANTAHGLRPVPPANGGAATTGSSAPGLFGVTTGMTTNTGRGLPPVPSAHGVAPTINRPGTSAPQGITGNTSAPTVHSGRGPFGTTKPTVTPSSPAPNVTSSSAGHGLPQLPTTRQPMTKPPQPQTHVAQPPTLPTNTSRGYRGYTAPTTTPQSEHTFAAPTHNFSPPHPPSSPQVAAPTHTFAAPHPQSSPQVTAPSHTFAAPAHPAPTPHVAAPAHVAPPAAPARPTGNAAVSHSAAPQPHPTTKDQKRNNNND
jgi:hypothetical protein